MAEKRDVKRSDREVEKALKRHGPSPEALAEAIRRGGKEKRR